MKNPNHPPHRPEKRGAPSHGWAMGVLRGCMGVAVLCALATTTMAQSTATSLSLDPWQPGQLTNPATQSTPHNDVRKLLRQAKYPQALQLVESALLKNPRDPQMRFWQAFIYEQTGNAPLAMPIYLALTQEYPELAEPHNNLGVLYAAQGDYDKARAAFEAALRSNPNYSTAHENLGDVLLASAKQSFVRAQQLGNKSAALAQKIDSLKPTLQRIETKP